MRTKKWNFVELNYAIHCDNTIRKRCKKNGIDLPKNGHLKLKRSKCT